ncbi:MAG: hypothetical protein R3E04_03195 [Sphingobium sp.]
MALSQVQIIQSLGEALTWFEKELAWGVEPAQLGHLTGRIGELYAAMITRGQMALATNQHGYDVVSADNERISVKTITSSSHVTFRKSTFHHVDRVLVLRINVDEGEASIEELLDCPVQDFENLAVEGEGDFQFRIRKAQRPRHDLDEMSILAQAHHGSVRIVQYENGTIIVERDDVVEPQAKPVLRDIAAQVGVSLLNANGNERNTRQLGSEILAVLSAGEAFNTA